MVEYSAELEEARLKDRMGTAMMRKVVIAVRVFLERSWIYGEGEVCAWDGEDGAETDNGDRQGGEMLRRLKATAPEGVIEEVRRMVESAEDWGGWPDDEAVRRYIQNSRFEDAR